MTNTPILNTLNKAGEALKALGEETVILGCYAPTSYRDTHSYSVRLELPGTSGVHGSGATPAEAYQNALIQRAADLDRMDREARIRAMVEAEEAGEQRRAA